MFYVYQLLDPRTDVPFYVGKGRNGRAWQHQREVEIGTAKTNAAKIAKIEEILRFGLEVKVEIVSQYESEVDALDHEFRLVSSMPCLTNIGPGGEGRPLSESELRARQQRYEQVRVAAICAARERRIERRREGLTSVASKESDRLEVEKWLAVADVMRYLARVKKSMGGRRSLTRERQSWLETHHPERLAASEAAREKAMWG